MAERNSLPPEILLHIARFLDIPTLKNLRLVSRVVSTFGAEKLFHTVSLHLAEDGSREGNPHRSLSSFNKIRESETLRSLVRRIVLDATDGSHYDEKEIDEDVGEFADEYTLTPWAEALSHLHEFPLLQEVEFAFTGCCGVDPQGEYEQDEEYREYYQKLLFEALGRAPLCDSLSIRNMQDALITFTDPQAETALVKERLRKLVGRRRSVFLYYS